MPAPRPRHPSPKIASSPRHARATPVPLSCDPRHVGSKEMRIFLAFCRVSCRVMDRRARARSGPANDTGGIRELVSVPRTLAVRKTPAFSQPRKAATFWRVTWDVDWSGGREPAHGMLFSRVRWGPTGPLCPLSVSQSVSQSSSFDGNLSWIICQQILHRSSHLRVFITSASEAGGAHWFICSTIHQTSWFLCLFGTVRVYPVLPRIYPAYRKKTGVGTRPTQAGLAGPAAVTPQLLRAPDGC
eukprot:gene22945-biopygen20786